jgi:hypothetical protein
MPPGTGPLRAVLDCLAAGTSAKNVNLGAIAPFWSNIIMLFMLVSRAKPGTKREQLVDRLTHEMHPETWDLVRHGELPHIYYKIGEEPGFFALLSASSLEEAKARVARALASVEEFEVDIYPVNHFPQFD